MPKDTPSLGLSASWQSLPESKLLDLRFYQVVIESQQAVLLVEDANFCEILQCYCINDVFHNYLLRVLDLLVISLQLQLKMNKCLEHFYCY